MVIVMYEVKIDIKNKDKYVGAMLKGLAFQISGRTPKGLTNELLNKQGYYIFSFSKQGHASEFKALSENYLDDYIEIE